MVSTKYLFRVIRKWLRKRTGACEISPRWRYATFPKKVYFLDGPLKDHVRDDVPACIKYVEEVRWDGVAYFAVEYIWDTLYPNAEVAYMRLSQPEVQSGYTMVTT